MERYIILLLHKLPLLELYFYIKTIIIWDALPAVLWPTSDQSSFLSIMDSFPIHVYNKLGLACVVGQLIITKQKKTNFTVSVHVCVPAQISVVQFLYNIVTNV